MEESIIDRARSLAFHYQSPESALKLLERALHDKDYEIKRLKQELEIRSMHERVSRDAYNVSAALRWLKSKVEEATRYVDQSYKTNPLFAAMPEFRVPLTHFELQELCHQLGIRWQHPHNRPMFRGPVDRKGGWMK